MKANVNLILQYADTFKYLDTMYLENILSNNFQYESPYLNKKISSKKEYINFLNDKFNLLKSSNFQILVRGYEHLIELFIETEQNKTQRIGTLRFTIENEKFVSALIFKQYIFDKRMIEILPV